jgi:hypothetical protein
LVNNRGENIATDERCAPRHTYESRNTGELVYVVCERKREEKRRKNLR